MAVRADYLAFLQRMATRFVELDSLQLVAFKANARLIPLVPHPVAIGVHLVARGARKVLRLVRAAGPQHPYPTLMAL